jgi:hypothetical protein
MRLWSIVAHIKATHYPVCPLVAKNRYTDTGLCSNIVAKSFQEKTEKPNRHFLRKKASIVMVLSLLITGFLKNDNSESQ